ncbi:MAG TPA: YraN family protein [Solirubrobacteraceae bacterium]|nr:YraN family protein [Solirubrobacteraceae bacterium]
MPTDSRKSLGRLGEQLAADHFERLGWRIVERNYQTRLGELDLVAADGDTLVFAEVKTCRLGRGQPWDSLHPRKQWQVRKIAGLWFSERRGPFFERVRFDAIGVLVDDRDALVRLDHLEHAF